MSPAQVAEVEIARRERAPTRTYLRCLGRLRRLLGRIQRRIKLLGTIYRRLPGGLRARLNQGGALAVFAPAAGEPVNAPRLLLVSHDLSPSGAPRLLAQVAAALVSDGYAVTVVSPTDGPSRELFTAAGAGVVVDAAALLGSPLLVRMAAHVEAVICNTIQTDGAVAALADHLPCLWYVHELSLLTERLAAEPRLAQTLRRAQAVWTGAPSSAEVIRRLGAEVDIIPYGLDAFAAPRAFRRSERAGPLRIIAPASIESRKGQDLAVEAVGLLSPDVRAQIELCLYGRILEAEFAADVMARIARTTGVRYGGELSFDQYKAALARADGVLLASRDDTLPLVSLDALCRGRVLLCTPTTGTADYLRDGLDGFVAAEPTAASIARMLERAVRRREAWPQIAAAGQAVFRTTFDSDAFNRRIVAAVREAIGSVRPLAAA